MKSLAISSLIAGLYLFLICASLTFFGLGHVLLLIVFFPGFIFGWKLFSYAPDNTFVLGNSLVLMLSGAIYIGCFFLLDFRNEDHLYLRLLALSAVGAVLLKVFYDLLVLKRITVMQTLLLPLLIGIGAAIPGATCLYCASLFRIDLLGLGIFSIYPLWFYGMGALVAHSIKQITLPKTISE